MSDAGVRLSPFSSESRVRVDSKAASRPYDAKQAGSWWVTVAVGVTVLAMGAVRTSRPRAGSIHFMSAWTPRIASRRAYG